MICRTTPWRQGSLIKQVELGQIGIAPTPEQYAIVISHDCDIPHPKEEVIEIIVGQIVQPNKMFQDCKNPRKLHLKIEKDGECIYLELSFQFRVLISKVDFGSALSGPDESFNLSESEKRTLKQWLSARFGRPAYPNEFENRIQKKIGKKDTVEKRIARLVEPVSQHIVGIFIGLDGDKNVELPPEEPYYLSLFIVYNTEFNTVQARVDCEKLADDIHQLLLDAYGHPGDASDICIESCAAVADTKITLVDLMKIDQWRLEWLSLTDGDDNFVALGQL